LDSQQKHSAAVGNPMAVGMGDGQEELSIQAKVPFQSIQVASGTMELQREAVQCEQVSPEHAACKLSVMSSEVLAAPTLSGIQPAYCTQESLGPDPQQLHA
jgi:hypothetical protein